jgi:hypothetical protein
MPNTGLAPLDTDGNDAKRGYGVGDAHRRGRHIGGRWRGPLVAREPRQRRHSRPQPQEAMMAGIMPGDPADYRAFETAGGGR